MSGRHGSERPPRLARALLGLAEALVPRRARADWRREWEGEIGARWGNITKKENFSLTGDLHAASPGEKSVRIASPTG